MHASLDQLLSLRDGAPVDAEIRVHVQQCAACLAESARLAQTRERLQALGSMHPPRDFWKDIEARAAAAPRRSSRWGVAAATAALLVGALSYLGLRESGHEHASKPLAGIERIAPEASADELEKLIAQSRELEALLEYLPEPQVERVSTVATVSSLEQSIQFVDWQLANGADGELDPRQTQRLWSERVDLMDSLVKVRYAQSAPMMF